MQNKVRIVVASNPECNIEKAVSVPYSCQYELGGKIRMIDSFGQYREVKGSELGYTNEQGNKVGHWPMMLEFSKTAMFHEYTFNDDSNADDYDKNTHDIIEKFYKQCPLFLVNGKPHSNTKSNKHFDLVDANIKTATAVSSFKTKLKASTALSNMSYQELCDVAYFYGKSPLNKTEDELLVELGDTEKGYCLSESILADFLNIFVDGKSADKDIIVVLNKAVVMEVVQNRPNDGRAAYFLGDTFLGSDMVGMIDWTRKNPRDYEEYVLRKVEEKDKAQAKSTAEVIKPVKVAAVMANGQKKVNLELFTQMKEEAKLLQDEGFFEGNMNKMDFVALEKALALSKAKKESVSA